jgi:hypothetical protein
MTVSPAGDNLPGTIAGVKIFFPLFRQAEKLATVKSAKACRPNFAALAALCPACFRKNMDSYLFFISAIKFKSLSAFRIPN